MWSCEVTPQFPEIPLKDYARRYERLSAALDGSTVDDSFRQAVLGAIYALQDENPERHLAYERRRVIAEGLAHQLEGTILDRLDMYQGEMD